jgi:hypothetical protein
MVVPGVSALSTFQFLSVLCSSYSAGSHQAVPRCLLSRGIYQFSLFSALRFATALVLSQAVPGVSALMSL